MYDPKDFLTIDKNEFTLRHDSIVEINWIKTFTQSYEMMMIVNVLNELVFNC